MPQVVRDYCGGTGRDAITPTQARCWKCGGIGVYWAQAKPGSPAAIAGPASTRRQYTLPPFIQSLLESVPRWLNVLLAIAGFVAAAAVGNTMDPPCEKPEHWSRFGDCLGGDLWPFATDRQPGW